MLVDDSIVRGTTCKQIIQMAREAGAKNVFLFGSPCRALPEWYGIDMPSAPLTDRFNNTAAPPRKSASRSVPTGWSTRICRI